MNKICRYFDRETISLQNNDFKEQLRVFGMISLPLK